MQDTSALKPLKAREYFALSALISFETGACVARLTHLRREKPGQDMRQRPV